MLRGAVGVDTDFSLRAWEITWRFSRECCRTYLDRGAHGKEQYASSLPKGQAINQQILVNECLSCFCSWPGLVLVAIWNTKKCVIPAHEGLNPVGDRSSNRDRHGAEIAVT